MSRAFDAFAESIEPCSCRREKWSCSFESFRTLGIGSCGRSKERRRFENRSSLACKAAKPTTELRREFRGGDEPRRNGERSSDTHEAMVGTTTSNAKGMRRSWSAAYTET